MLDESVLGSVSVECLLERADDELRTRIVLERPTDDAAARLAGRLARLRPSLPPVGDRGVDAVAAPTTTPSARLLQDAQGRLRRSPLVAGQDGAAHRRPR